MLKLECVGPSLGPGGQRSNIHRISLDSATAGSEPQCIWNGKGCRCAAGAKLVFFLLHKSGKTFLFFFHFLFTTRLARLSLGRLGGGGK